MALDRIQFRPGPLASALTARGGDDNASAAQVAARDLDRYYQLLALALASVDLTPGEAGLIVDALNGSLMDVSNVQLLAYAITDSYEDGLPAKWEVDAAALSAKLRGWTLLQRMAVGDAVERFWSQANHLDSTTDRLALVGLVKRG